MCQKQQYDKRTAICALKEAKKQGKSHKWRKEVRVYECPKCKMWHLTSKEEFEEIIEIPEEELIFRDKWLKLKSP